MKKLGGDNRANLSSKPNLLKIHTWTGVIEKSFKIQNPSRRDSIPLAGSNPTLRITQGAQIRRFRQSVYLGHKLRLRQR